MADPKSRDEVIAIANRVADQWGLPRLLLLATGIAESNLRWDARRPVNPADDERYWQDVSAGVWQQVIRYDPEYSGGGPFPGPAEIARVMAFQYDVERSAHVAAANLKQKLSLERGDPLTDATDDQMLRAMYRYNWPAGGGRPHSPAHEQNYRRGLAEAKQILGSQPVQPTPLPYNPDAPVDQQPDLWSCALQSVQFLLRSIGRTPDASDPTGDPWLRSQLVPGLISPDAGLRDGSGKQLADWITRTYGGEMGFTAQASPVTFDDVWAGAGTNPMIVGGHRWGPGGHWAGVRRQDGPDALLIANPANGFTGIQQRITRAEWNNRAPWDCIWIDRMRAAPAPEPPAPPAITKAQVVERLRGLLAMQEQHAAKERAELTALLEMAERLP